MVAQRTRRVNLKELETRTLTGVEILSPGRWNGRVYSEAELDAAVDAFRELGPAGSGQIRPPGKLGHDDSQTLAQADGFPAIGWVSRLYRVGKKLMADFSKVPAMVADLINVGAYDSISSECYLDLKLNDKVYPFVIGAVSFLGADSPAVKDIRSISDVAALFSDKDFADRVVLTVARDAKRLADFSFEDIRDELNEELAKRFPTDVYDRPWVMETYPTTFVFADSVGRYWQAGYSIDAADGEITLNEPFTEVNRVVSWAAVAESLTEQLSRIRIRTKSKETPMDLKKLAQALGLTETATEDEVLAEIAKAKAGPTVNNSDELRLLRDEVGKLKAEGAQTQARSLVEGAIKSAKIVPAQREWAESYALSDPEGFKVYVEKAPKLTLLSAPTGNETAGSEASVTDDTDKPSRVESTIASQLGVDSDALAKAREGRTGAQLMEEARKLQTAGAK